MSENCSSSYFISSAERQINDTARGIAYCLGIVYCFLGLSAITARFFLGMENIIAHTRAVLHTDPVTRRVVVKRDRFWNCTVADITLLAFGTSFPQISLSTIDAIMNIGNLYAGGVGPGTLVGSAACDLYLIHAMCIIIPKRGSIKKVLDLGVWLVELLWSLWAYVWLYIILLVWTPEVITVWEAILTVLQFFILVLHAYAQDRQWPFISISLLDQKKRKDWMSSDARTGEALKPPPEVADSEDAEDVISSMFGGKIAEQYEFSLLADRKDSDSSTIERREWPHTLHAWKQQFYAIFTLDGCRDSNGKFLPCKLTIFYEILVFPWRFLFAFVPPSTVCHGWVTFLCSLAYITGISYIVTRLTNVIGCVTGINSYVIALTILATGTSWPDLAASMIAAYRQSTADSAIANITCSNSVNIFIGIGVPWVINTVYNAVVLKEPLRVPSLQLGFILMVYFVTFILCVGVVVSRRYFLGGELGGPRAWAWASSAFILFLWVVFLVLSCLRIYGVI